MAPGEERGDSQRPGLRVRCSATGKKVFLYRYRSQDGALREIILGDVGPLTLANRQGRWSTAREPLSCPLFGRQSARFDAARDPERRRSEADRTTALTAKLTGFRRVPELR